MEKSEGIGVFNGLLKSVRMDLIFQRRERRLFTSLELGMFAFLAIALLGF